MEIITSVKEMQRIAEAHRKEGKRIGVVPTMGYLHEGHLSLLSLMRNRCDIMVMTLFVNPIQFGPSEDFAAYPHDFDRDSRLAEREGVDIIFAPSDKEMYPAGYQTFVEVPEMGKVMCGKFRPGHFRGVTTVVAKLFNCVKPHAAIFGQKDAQQAAVLKRMTKDLNIDVEIMVAPFVREKDGLAMSSRNVYLTAEEREEALALSQSLFLAEKLVKEGTVSVSTITVSMEKHIRKHPGVNLEYIAVVHPDTLEPVEKIQEKALIALAAHVGKARLIDNIIVSTI